MADELQALLERIKEQGIDKAEAEQERILGEARGKAAKIVAEAKDKAEKIVADGKREAELLHSKGEEALRLASRDVLLSLRERLYERMAAVVGACVGKAASGKALHELIVTVVGAYIKQAGEERSLMLLVPEKEAEAVADHLFDELGKDLRKRTSISPVKGMESGFQLNVVEENCTYDFSNEALTEVLCTFLNPRLAALVKGEKSGQAEQRK